MSHNTHKENTMPARNTTSNALAHRSSSRTSRSTAARARRPERTASPRSASRTQDVVRGLKVQGQRLLRKRKEFSKARREECYQKVASMPLAKQHSFWKNLIALLKHGASRMAAAWNAVYQRHWNSLLWATAGLSLGWLIETMFTIHVPFLGAVRLVHWAFKWISAVAGAAYGIWSDSDYRTKTATAVSFA